VRKFAGLVAMPWVMAEGAVAVVVVVAFAVAAAVRDKGWWSIAVPAVVVGRVASIVDEPRVRRGSLSEWVSCHNCAVVLHGDRVYASCWGKVIDCVFDRDEGESRVRGYWVGCAVRGGWGDVWFVWGGRPGGGANV